MEHSGRSEIELERDGYWEALSREKIYADPELGIGSLEDDLEMLRKVLDGTYPLSTNDFYRLGNIIIAIGEKIYYS